MSKYAALETFLRSQNKASIPATFAEIEKVVGQPLPASAKYPAWWSNNPSNNSMTKFWRRAGYRTEQVDIARKTLVFRRVLPMPEPATSARQHQATMEKVRAMIAKNQSKQNAKGASVAESARTFSAAGHPLRGALKGMLRLVGGTDLTRPADPKWGDA